MSQKVRNMTDDEIDLFCKVNFNYGLENFTREDLEKHIIKDIITKYKMCHFLELPKDMRDKIRTRCRIMLDDITYICLDGGE